MDYEEQALQYWLIETTIGMFDETSVINSRLGTLMNENSSL